MVRRCIVWFAGSPTEAAIAHNPWGMLRGTSCYLATGQGPVDAAQDGIDIIGCQRESY